MRSSSNPRSITTPSIKPTAHFHQINPNSHKKSWRSKRSSQNIVKNKLATNFSHYKPESKNLTQSIKPSKTIDIFKCLKWKWPRRWENSLRKKSPMLLPKPKKRNSKESISSNSSLGSWKAKKTTSQTLLRKRNKKRLVKIWMTFSSIVLDKVLSLNTIQISLFRRSRTILTRKSCCRELKTTSKSLKESVSKDRNAQTANTLSLNRLISSHNKSGSKIIWLTD